MQMPLLVTMLAAFLAAVLSGLGLGSAGIFVLYLTILVGLPQVEAQGMNLIFFLLSAGTSLIWHVRQRRIPWRLVLLLAVCAIPGTLIGSWLVRVLDADLIRRVFGVMLVISGLPALLPKKKKNIAKEK